MANYYSFLWRETSGKQTKYSAKLKSQASGGNLVSCSLGFAGRVYFTRSLSFQRNEGLLAVYDNNCVSIKEYFREGLPEALDTKKQLKNVVGTMNLF